MGDPWQGASESSNSMILRPCAQDMALMSKFQSLNEVHIGKHGSRTFVSDRVQVI